MLAAKPPVKIGLFALLCQSFLNQRSMSHCQASASYCLTSAAYVLLPSFSLRRLAVLLSIAYCLVTLALPFTL